jgi:glutathionyl-hydroquinone reductase
MACLEREVTRFRHLITRTVRPVQLAEVVSQAEKGRYHLCQPSLPWAHRMLIMRRLKGLEEIVTLSVAHWLMGAESWTFTPGRTPPLFLQLGVEAHHPRRQDLDARRPQRATLPKDAIELAERAASHPKGKGVDAPTAKLL